MLALPGPNFRSLALLLMVVAAVPTFAAEDSKGDSLVEAQGLALEAEAFAAHRDFDSAIKALDKACAKDPANLNFRYELVRLLPAAAIEILDPGGQRSHRRLKQKPTREDLGRALRLGHRSADLLSSLCSEAAESVKRGRAIPICMKPDAYGNLGRLIEKLADQNAQEASLKEDAKALFSKERNVRLELIEPYLRSRVHDAQSLSEYSGALFWLALNSHLGSYDPVQWRRDGSVVVQRWLDLAGQHQPTDASGSYAPLMHLTLVTGSKILTGEPELFEPIWQRCAASPDPVLKAYARLGRIVAASKNERSPSANTVAAVRELRSSLQTEIVGLASEDENMRAKLFGLIEQALPLTMNNAAEADEYFQACEFALEQKAARPSLFSNGLTVLRAKDKGEQAARVAAGVLKLIKEQPERFSHGEKERLSKTCQSCLDQYGRY